jgi:hypothetical protein
MLNLINPITIGNNGMLGGLAGSIASLQDNKDPSSRIIFCETSRAISEVPGATLVDIICIGGGGGGGSGCLATASNTAAGGGGGGGNAAYMSITYPVAALIFPLVAAVGAAGTGGAEITGTNASGNPGLSGGSTIVFASGLYNLTDGTASSLTSVNIASATGGGGGGGGTATAAGAAGAGTNTLSDQHLSVLGNPGGLAGGFPTPLTVTDNNLAGWYIPRGGGGGGGFTTNNNTNSGGWRSSNRPWFWGRTGAENTSSANARRWPYLMWGGYGGVGGASSLTTGGSGGAGFRGGGGGGGGAGRVTSGTGGNGGDGCAIFVFR